MPLSAEPSHQLLGLWQKNILTTTGAGDPAQWRTMWSFTTAYNCSSRAPDTIFGWESGTHLVHIYTCRQTHTLKTYIEGWSDGSTVKNTCSSKGPRLSSQHPCGGSQPSTAPVLENGTPSSGLHGHFMHLVDIHTCSQNTYINKSNLFNNIE